MFQSLALPSSSFSSQFPVSNSINPHRKMSLMCRAATQSFAEPANFASSLKPDSLYEVLRVKKNASATEIKAAYRSLAKLYHPDVVSESERHSDSDSDFIEIHNAYETLSDPVARALYDLSLGLGRGERGLSSSSSSSFGYYSMCRRSGFYPTRRWETDQCW